MMTPALATLLTAVLAAWLTFLAWTIWKLWLRRDKTLDPRVYTLGVQMFGISTWAGTTLLLLYMRITEFAAVAAFMLPAFLWAGFFWGEAMARLSNNRWRGP